MESILSFTVAYWQAAQAAACQAAAALAFDPALLAEPGMALRLALQVLLLMGSAFFSSAETALFSLSRLDLQQLRREKNPRAESIHELLDQPRKLIISILSGNELVNIAAAANMTSILVELYGSANAGWLNLLVMVPLLLLLGEVTPKTIAVHNPVRYSTRIAAAPMRFWVRLMAPLRWAIRGVAERITTWLVGEPRAADNILQVDEVLTLVEQVAEEGVLDATERALIYKLLEASDTEIVEMMTPRTRMAFLNMDMSVPEMVEKFIACRHSRMPVFKTHRDNLVGFVHAEDVLRLVLDGRDLEALSPHDIMHPPVVVPLTKKVDEMFDFFQGNEVRAAACLNEFGGVEGFITMGGVINFIFGDVSGGTRATADYYAEKDNNIYEVPGDMKLNDFDNLANFGMDDPRMTTIGGVAFRHLDRLPREGDKVRVDDIMIQVLEMDAHRIARVRVAQGVDDDDFERAGEVSAEIGAGADDGAARGTVAAAAEVAEEVADEVAEGVADDGAVYQGRDAVDGEARRRKTEAAS
ncbi:MAG: hemolysin family protein [Gammaproteobacteria bacterium]|nr:hemolysin family protein [Gammaproteobacteria bacterium]